MKPGDEVNEPKYVAKPGSDHGGEAITEVWEDDASMDMGRPTVEEEHGPNPEPIVLQIAALNDAIDREIAAWSQDIEPGANPGNVGVDQIALSSQIEGLIAYLQRIIPNFDIYQFEHEWKSRYLMKCRNIRNNIKTQRTRQEILQGVSPAMDIKKGQHR